jgi:hypothetical protein
VYGEKALTLSAFLPSQINSKIHQVKFTHGKKPKLGVTQNLEKNKAERMVTIYLGKPIEYMAKGF